MKKQKDKLDFDPHIICYSYPNCDEAPLGCVVENGLDAEPYGHRDRENEEGENG